MNLRKLFWKHIIYSMISSYLITQKRAITAFQEFLLLNLTITCIELIARRLNKSRFACSYFLIWHFNSNLQLGHQISSQHWVFIRTLKHLHNNISRHIIKRFLYLTFRFLFKMSKTIDFLYKITTQNKTEIINSNMIMELKEFAWTWL